MERVGPPIRRVLTSALSTQITKCNGSDFASLANDIIHKNDIIFINYTITNHLN